MRYASRVRYVQRAIRVYFGKQRLVVEDAGAVDSSSMIVHVQSITCHARGYCRRVLITRPARAAYRFALTTVCAITKAHKIRPDDGMCHHEIS